MDQLMAVYNNIGPLGVIGGIIFILICIGVVKSLCTSKGKDGNSNSSSGSTSSTNNTNNNNGGSNS